MQSTREEYTMASDRFWRKQTIAADSWYLSFTTFKVNIPCKTKALRAQMICLKVGLLVIFDVIFSTGVTTGKWNVVIVNPS